MFYLIGIGLKPQHLTLEAREAIEKCSRVFVETYTSAYSEGSLKELKALVGKEIIELNRHAVEEGFRLILKDAKKSNEDIALLVFGNPLSATTHVQLLIDARKLGINAKVLPGISIYNFLGATGLDQYRFGRTATIVAWKPGYAPESFYDIIEKNKRANLHTLCLLDTGNGQDDMMSVNDALDILEKIEKKRNSALIKNSVLIGLYGIGSRKEMIVSGNLQRLKGLHLNIFPQSLIVAAKLNEKEKEAISALGG